MVRNLRDLFGRAGLTEQEMCTVSGVTTCSAKARHTRR